MVRYRRNLVPGGTYFFTVTLEDRRADTLTAHVDLLRLAFRTAQAEYPFQIDAVVILPEHLHVLMTLPEDDARFALRWQRIKTVFTQGVRRSGAPLGRRDVTGRALWQRRFWEHTIRDDADYARHVEYVHFNPVRHGSLCARAIGDIRRCTGIFGKALLRRIGRVVTRTVWAGLGSGGPRHRV